MTTEREHAFWHIQYDGFSPTGPEDDMLHPLQNAEREGDSDACLANDLWDYERLFLGRGAGAVAAGR
jgi:hypothetical protein